MTKDDIYEFIECMEEIGDIWEPADVERVYGNKSIQEAIDDRMAAIYAYANNIDAVLNR